jgi:predicted transposase/invertase (TIGR01784 family)
MARYLDPKNDLVFKKIFGEHPLLLKDFLNALLPLPEDGQIIDLSYLQPEQVPMTPLSYRRGIVDVKCIDQQGRTFIVEMQMFWTTVFRQRMLFNASQAYVQQLAPGQDFRLLQPVYALGLINDTFDPGADWYHHYKIVNIDNPQRQIEGLQFVFIELPKFKAETAVAKKVRLLWLRFLKEIGGELDAPADLLSYPPIQEALTISQEAGFSRAELLAYQDVLDAIRTETSYVGEKVAEAEARGHEQGIQVGRQDEKLTIAKNMLAVLDDAAIAKITGLSVAEVQKLRNT